MPEGPEVEKIRNLLEKKLIGCDLSECTETSHPALTNAELKKLKKIISVSRKGKHLFIGGENDFILHHHLGMTGWWTDHTTPATKVVINLYSNDKLVFSDKLQWGSIFEILTPTEALGVQEKLGPDWLSSESVPFDLVCEKLKKHRRLKLDTFLLKQEIFCSLGNYLKAEILFEAKLDPRRKLSSLTEDEILPLHQYAKDITLAASTYDVNEPYPKKIYGHKMCPYNHEISKYKSSDGRTTYWCEVCQQ